MSLIWIKIGSFFMLTGVGLGAFGAHALKNQLTEYDLNVFRTAVLYQLIHAIALLVIGILSQYVSDPKVIVSGRFFVAGIILFSGSLYLLATTHMKWLGPITPLGGLCFMIGWGLLCFLKGTS